MSHTYRYNEDEVSNKKFSKPKKHVKFYRQHDSSYPDYVSLTNEISDALLENIMHRTSRSFITVKQQDNYRYSVPLIEQTNVERNLSYLSAHILNRHSLIKKEKKLIPTKAHKENGYFYIAHEGFGEGNYPKEIGNIIFHYLNLPAIRIFIKQYEGKRFEDEALFDVEEAKEFTHKLVIVKDFSRFNPSQFTNITSEDRLPRGIDKMEGIGMTPLKSAWPIDRTVMLVPTMKVSMIIRITKELFKALMDQKHENSYSMEDLPFENNALILSMVPVDDRVL